MSYRQQRQGLRLSAKKAADAVARLKLQSPSPETQEQLQRKNILLSSYLTRLETFDKLVLEEISDEADVEQEIANFRTFNEGVEEAIADSQPLPNPPSLPSPSGSGGMGNVSGVEGESYIRVNLPKLEIPTFGGDPVQWQEFWDAFNASIHKRPDLAVINKFTYLRGLLVGEAQRLVEGFRVTEANYREVVDLLTQRYGDKQAIIFAHVEALLSRPPASGDAVSLVNTHTKLERHLRSLDSLQPDQNMILHSVILSKLPRFLKVEAHRKATSQSDWSLAQLRKWLSEEARAREMGERLHRLNVAGRNSAEPSFKGGSTPREPFRARKSGSSASALISDGREAQCPFCNGHHLPEECTKYSDTESRRAQLRDRCFICLCKGHLAKACRRRKPCKFCKRSTHNSCFCFTKFGRPKPKTDRGLPEFSGSVALKQEGSLRDTSTTSSAVDSSVLLTSDGKRERTVMQTALVLLENKKCRTSVTARLFFDTGASRTFITEAKRRELRLPSEERQLLSVSGFQSLKRHTSEHKMVEFGVQCRDGTVQNVKAAVVPSITCPILKVPLSSDALTVPEWSLAEPLVKSSEYVGLDVLIGMDYYFSFVSPQGVSGGENLWFLSSKVGFLASGRVSTTEPGPETVAVMFVKSMTSSVPIEPPRIDLTKYWELEEIGMKEDQGSGYADEEAMSLFSSSVKFMANRYEVCWPWKTPTLELKNNYGLALGRLRSLINRMKRTPSTMEAYAAVFNSQLASGIIEKAPSRTTGNMVYYMPHHCILKPGYSTTKLQVVFDASSKVAKDIASLNDCMHRGPVLLEDLCGLLLRFRTHAVALVSDIEKAFLQIGLQPSQRDAARLLWVQSYTQPPTGDNLFAYRFCRVPFGVIASPFLLAATVSHHLKQAKNPIAAKILRDIYVDNVITGEASPSEAILHYRAAKSIFASASMNLREWYSNSTAVLDAIPDLDQGKQAEPKVLGVRWNTKHDTLRLAEVKLLDDGSHVTKRSILKALPQLFDPCGFLAPIVVTAKILLQDLWALKIDWDEPIPQELSNRWSKLIVPNIALAPSIVLSRYIGVPDRRNVQLHVFCDASKRACAAVVYFQQENADLTAKVDLLMAKSRLAPMNQKLTVPRLELVAVVLGARILEFVSRHLGLEIANRFIWTYSQCVLHWVRKEDITTRFTGNRLKELHQVSGVQFRYTPSAENPADLPTRGCTVQNLVGTSLWWHGPEWLRKNATEWPVFPAPQERETLASTPDVPVMELSEAISAVNVIDENRYSSLNRLLRVTAYVFRFTKNATSATNERRKGNLLLEEINFALRWWIKTVQANSFSEFNGHIEPRQGNKTYGLGTFHDEEGIIRCSGRIQLADIPYDVKHPILLPKIGHFTDLVARSYHLKGLHSGVGGKLARIRHQFWIINGRTVVKRTIANCRICHRFDSGPFKMPPVPVLPKFRLENSSPFTNTGVDYFGLLYIRASGAERTKVWIVLFTCAVTRAVHLEITETMTTEHFLLALRRFIARFGAPELLVSDNGNQFHTSSRLFQKWVTNTINSDECQTLFMSHRIEWKFITEMAPWMGGFYERLVAVVKQALRKTLFANQLTLTELQTVVAEIITVVNSKPLVYIEDEVGNNALCPMHLLSPSRRDELLLAPLRQTKIMNNRQLRIN